MDNSNKLIFFQKDDAAAFFMQIVTEQIANKGGQGGNIICPACCFRLGQTQRSTQS